MLKVVTIVGTRPEIIRLSRVIAELDLYCDNTLVHTGQNHDYELNEVFFEQLKIRKPDVFLNAASSSPAQTIGNIIIKFDGFLEKHTPEALLLLGDTNSALASIVAKRRKIPIFHMEAGNRCFDFRVPEEINRRIVDHIADVHLTYSQIARDYLLREGLPPDLVIKTGSPMREVLHYYSGYIDKSTILSKLKLKPHSYYLVSSHREENVDQPERLQKLIQIINFLAEAEARPVVFSTHPRTRSRLDSLDIELHSNVLVSKPFGFLDYVKLQTNAICVISDSGTITEESSILNFPALNIRDMHERPEGFIEGAVMFVGLSLERIKQGLIILKDQPRGENRGIELVDDYTTKNVSKKIVRIIHSYTDYVNRVVWKKY